MNLADRRIVLGVCGGVAAYKSVELCRRLVDAGAFVSPVLTESATRFVGAATFAALASEPPRMTLWNAPEPSPHTQLGQNADLVVVAPATARLVGSLANGLSDDLLATTLLATRAPVVLAPAMHTEMWEHPAVQQNMATLRSRGVNVVEPEVGHLAGGDQGVGRLASTESILAAIETQIGTGGALAGCRVLVTAGGTREAIDPVRFIGNRSSGKQGFAFAQVAAAMGAEVTLISTAEPKVTHPRVRVSRVESAEYMHRAVMHELADHDVLIMAAAVADFTPVHAHDNKLKKSDGVPEVQLRPTVDILKEVADKRRDDQVVVGFAAETSDLLANATAKLQAKKVDLMVANDVSSPGVGFDSETNRALILSLDGKTTDTGLMSKHEIATGVLRQVAQLLQTINARRAQK